MRTTTSGLLLPILLLNTVGCATAYKHVMISVVDATTQEPVAGAKVSTSYFRQYPLSRGSRIISKAATDTKGNALLSANYLRRNSLFRELYDPDNLGPSYDVSISTNDYNVTCSIGISPSTRDELFTRSPNFMPTTPDIVVQVRSEREKERDRLDMELKRKDDEEKAATLFSHSPDYWPEHKDDPYPYVSDQVGELLLEKRWNAASKKALSSQDESDQIRAVVVGSMKQANPTVEEMRWVSPTLVMVTASWYAGPLASAGYTYIVRKDEGRWHVLVYYMEYVS
jgi:hypothetical protein